MHPSLIGRPHIGFMLSPGMGNRIPDGALRAADAGTWRHPHDFDLGRYLAWLTKRAYARARCLFAVCPDVPGDGAATRARRWMLAELRALGYPTAYVSQPGDDLTDLPWPLVDCLFLGGPDGHHRAAAAQVAQLARRHGKWARRGRVNTRGRLRATAELGYDSCDGTCAARGPDVNGPKLRRWLGEINAQAASSLFALCD